MDEDHPKKPLIWRWIKPDDWLKNQDLDISNNGEDHAWYKVTTTEDEDEEDWI